MGTKCNAVSITMLLCAIAVLIPTEVSGYDEGSHRYIVAKALECYENSRSSILPRIFIEAMAIGAAHEDDGDKNSEDHIFNYLEPLCCYPHFWDIDDDPGYSYQGIDALVQVGGLDYPNAWMKASGYHVSQFGNSPRSPEGVGLWQQAKWLYSTGDYWNAYERLGHVCHLMADMSVPAHVHEDLHPSEDEYEDTISANITEVLAYLDPVEFDKGLIPIPDNNTLIAPELWPLFYLMYTTNQRADFFASEDDRGDGIDWLGLVDYSDWDPFFERYYQWPSYVDTKVLWCWVCGALQCIVGEGSSCQNLYCEQCYKNGRGLQPLYMDHPQWLIARRVTLVYAVRATATLFEEFLKEVDQGAPITSIGIGFNRYIPSDGQVCISPDTPVTLTAIDDAAGVAVTGYRVKGGGYDSDWLVYDSPFTLNQVQAGLADGPYTILYRSADYAKNLEGDKSKEVYLTTNAVDYRVSLSTGGSYLGIQAAIDAATAGSTIEVRPGTFRECVDFKGKAIVLRGIGGAEVTTINAGGGLHVVSFINAEGNGSILDGFTITGGIASGVGLPNDSGAGILCSGTQPVIRNCIITNNYAAGQGGGIFMATMFPVLQNCLIYNNTANNGGGLLSFYSQPTIANCTFSANVAMGGFGGAIAAFANDYSNAPILRNCILWGNTPLGIACNYPLIITGCNVQNLDPVYHPYNLTCDPKFVDAAKWNFRLAADSPCIGAGNNDATYPDETDLDGYLRILDGRCDGTAVVDMGAYEFSYADQGDLDADCAVDLTDLAMMAAVWMADPADRTIDIAPGPAGDGLINILDFAILAEHWMRELK